jgi:hypothetical protein
MSVRADSRMTIAAQNEREAEEEFGFHGFRLQILHNKK